MFFCRNGGARQIFDLTIESVQISCGSGVPFMPFAADRGAVELTPFFDRMGPSGVEAYWRKKNTRSIDGKPTGLFGDEMERSGAMRK
ncbi:MAG: hypothetical protein MRY74_02730 [Neomegalonema sp.]|nr:hypothetical protein [Neomegalonema sp.]